MIKSLLVILAVITMSGCIVSGDILSKKVIGEVVVISPVEVEERMVFMRRVTPTVYMVVVNDHFYPECVVDKDTFNKVHIGEYARLDCL